MWSRDCKLSQRYLNAAPFEANRMKSGKVTVLRLMEEEEKKEEDEKEEEEEEDEKICKH